MQLDDLQLFSAVVDAGSLTKAAQILTIPKSKISRRLAQLEKHLDSQLLVRTTRSQQLTEAGEVLYRASKPHIEALLAAQDALNDFQQQPKGHLKILFPLEFFSRIIAELIAKFALLYPDILISCYHYSQTIPDNDLSYDLIFVLHEQPLSASQWIGRNLLSFPQSLYAGHKLKIDHIKKPSDLSNTDCVQSTANKQWLFRHSSSTEMVNVRERIVLSSPEMRLSAVKEDLGVAIFPDYLINSQQHDQSLKRVELTCSPVAQQLTVLYQSRSLAKKTRVFLDFFQSNIGSLQ
ncbi:LysR family transcriptional regulator [Thalassotalea piscium]